MWMKLIPVMGRKRWNFFYSCFYLLLFISYLKTKIMKAIGIILAILIGCIFLMPLTLEIIIHPKMNKDYLIIDLIRIFFLSWYSLHFAFFFGEKFYKWFKSNIK